MKSHLKKITQEILLNEQIKVFKKFEENLKIRNEYKEQDRKKISL